MTIAYQRADEVLDTHLRGGATPHLWLHTGSPGAAGTANVAQTTVPANVVRKPLTFADAPANHTTNNERFVLNTAEVEWTGAQIASGQTITHVSVWSALSGGDILFISAVGTPKVVGSDGVKVPISNLEVAMQVFVKP